MRSKPAIAIAGATGVIGSEIVSLINERKFPCGEVRLCDSEDSEGELYSVLGEKVAVEALDQAAVEGLDIVFLAAGAPAAGELAPAAVECGAVVIDASPAFRAEQGGSLVVPEVNAELLTEKTRLIASPAPAVVQLAPVLKVIDEAAGLRRVVVFSAEAVSDVGELALDELWNQVRSVFTQQEAECSVFPQPLAFNCIPEVGAFGEGGDNEGEAVLLTELPTVLGVPNLRVAATAVRMPVFHGHAQSVSVETEKELSPAELGSLLQEEQGIKLWESAAGYPTPIAVAGTDDVHVGRLRKDPSVEHGLQLWLVADNLRRGAALNMVRIAEELVERFSD